jgi:HPt (histidine-containing phosphotransfer) domain-containing protein
MLTSDLLAEDPDLIDLIDKFMTRLPDMQSAINQSYNDKQWEEFSGLIHQMKGVGGGYGYPMLTDLCAEIEEQLRNQSMDNVAKLIVEFNELAEQILAGSEENHKIANKAG